MKKTAVRMISLAEQLDQSLRLDASLGMVMILGGATLFSFHV